MAKKKNLKVLKIIGLVVGIIAGIIVLTISGFHTFFLVSTPESFVIEKGENYFEYETGKDSAGYAAAYALRTLGDDVNGKELYEQIADKKYDTMLLQKGIPQEKIYKYGFAFEGKTVLIG